MRKTFFSRLWILGVCSFAVMGALASVQSIHAAGGWSGPGTTPSGNSNCENKTYTKVTGNRCGGISWVMRPVDTAHAACIAIGATHYYKLGWLMYTGPGSNPRYTGDIGRSAIKTSAGRNLPYRIGIASGSVSWAKAESDYQVAKQYIPAGYPSWPELGEFCWNPDWACPEGECPDPEIPDPDDDTIYGEGSFWADSYLTVSNEVATHTANVSSKEGASHSDVTIKVSTDSSATVTFRHTMSYDEELWNPTSTTYTSQAREGHAPASTDDFEEIKTKLKIQQYGVSSSSIKDEDFGTGNSGDKSGKDVSTTTVSVSPLPGETLSVCQVLTHQSVKYVIKGEDNDSTEDEKNEDGTTKKDEAGNTVTKTVHDDWEFSKHSEDNNVGLTMLCAEVYRPEDPNGGDPDVWAKSTGQNDTAPMFVGETSQIGWDTHAEWEEARRVRGWQAIAFTVPSNVGYNRSNVTGDLSGRGSAGPCDFYRKAGWGPNDTWCSIIGGRSASGDLGGSGTHEYDESQTIALQDYVGYKYCASFGYYWEYWYSISYSGEDNWSPEGKSYWTNYNAACRTIAKKPSSTFWNSGILTNGGIKTSLSPRIVGVGAAQTASLNQFNFLYGSWSEHLAAVGGTTASFGSGSALSRGSSNSVGAYNNIYPRSPMTISNTNSSTLGHSGIHTSNTLRTRLNTYLSNRPNIDSISSLPSVITSGTYILNIAGNLTINRNIIVSGGNYASIYQIPQVVIFVSGDVNIKGNVTEVDAWIIASGKINTCSDFQSKSTQTASRVYNNNTVCDQQLIINGPVMASKAELRRSYGSDPVIQGARYTPGEIFNLSGENYLWAYAQAGRYSSSYTEAYSRELAPRY